jgi:integrase
MKVPLLKIKDVPANGYRRPRFLIDVPPSRTGTKRARRYFESWEAADAYRRRVAGPGGFFGAEQNHTQEESTAKPLAFCVADWISKVYGNDRNPSERTRVSGQVWSIGKRLSEKFGKRPIDLIKPEELEDWFQEMPLAPVTRENYWRVTKRFFKWCHERAEVIDRNPMIKVDPPKVPYEPPNILTPAQMQASLGAAQGDVEAMAWLCLGGFCGLRSCEIYRLDWEDINWVDGIINIRRPKRVPRWHPRFLEEEKPREGDGPNTRFFQTLRRHLEPIALKSGPITKEKRVEDLRIRAAMIMGLNDWPANCLRHSFASYHVAVEKNFPKLQALMGHADPRLTKYIYSIAIPRAEAERWWNL